MNLNLCTSKETLKTLRWLLLRTVQSEHSSVLKALLNRSPLYIVVTSYSSQAIRVSKEAFVCGEKGICF